MAPFNAIALGLGIWLFGLLRQRLFHPIAGGARLIIDTTITRVRLPQCSPILWGLATAGSLGFIGAFVVAIATAARPGFALMTISIAIVYGGGAAVYLWQRHKITSGQTDLIINDLSRTIELPLTFHRTQRRTVAIKDIQEIRVDKITHIRSKGGNYYTYAPTLHLRGTTPKTAKLADWYNQSRADSLAQWLRQRLLNSK